jgi:hypothetical protein
MNGRPVKTNNTKPAGKEIRIVSRRLSRNSTPTVAMPTFQSVADFVSAYEEKDKTIADLTVEFVDAAEVAKEKQDDIVPQLAFMQSLLSKKGSNHHLIIKARKEGHKIPWWTDYFDKYKDRIWESLRTMERRINAYRKDPSILPIKRGQGNKPKHLTQLEHKLLGTAANAREAIVYLRAGRIEEAIAKLDTKTPTQDRIDEHLERGVKPSHDNPDGDAKRRSDEPDPTPIDPADALKTALANEPDSDVASKLLTDYLLGDASQFANGRIEIKEVSAKVIFANRDKRIMPGDYLAKGPTAQGEKSLLCRCTGVAEFMQRRRVQEWTESEWEKEHVVFSDHERWYQVISEEVARVLAPEAFVTVGL